MEVIELDREEYLTSVKKISDFDSLKFAKQALDWWDDYYSWSKFPPLCLIENREHVAYLFYTISKNNDYLTIHNILTPKSFRYKGFAYKLLDELFTRLAERKIVRFKMFCVSSSLFFYNKVGLNYWGVNQIGQYYCDFKMPIERANEIPLIVKKSSVDEFSKIKLDEIFGRLRLNGREFEEREMEIFEESLVVMGSRYMFDTLLKRAEFFGIE